MDMERLAEIFEAVKVMPLRPHDFLVFKTNARVGLDQQALLHAYLEQETGHTRILIVDGGADMEVLRFEEAPAEAAAPQEPATPAHRPISERPAVMPSGKAPGAIA